MKFTKYFIAISVLAAGIAVFAKDSSNGLIQKQYHGIRPDDKGGRQGLLNPERGFRWENRFGSFNPSWADKRWINSIKGCRQDGLTMTQGYCEMIAYAKNMQIPEKQITQLENSFAALRKNGLKVLLCFRYEMNTRQEGPTLEVILSHIKQLKPVLRRNMDVIAVFQTGFVGLYGEWHRSYHKLDRNPAAQEKIISALLDMLPADRKMVIRYPRHKNTYVKRVSGRGKNIPITAAEAHTMRPEARIGFCDHGFMVGKNDAGTFAPRPSKDYDYMTGESLFVPMEGEFFWTFNRPYGVSKDDGLEAVKRFWEHHYTLFSYAHNHSRYEGWKWKEKYNARYSLDEWKNETITPDFLKKNNIPFSVDYFKGANGKLASRSIFEYVRDHLGYRLELTKGIFPENAASGKNFKAAFSLVNRGFAAPINPRPVYLVLIGKNKVFTIGKAKADVQKWYPCNPVNRKILAPVYTLNFAVESFPEVPAGKYKLGIWMPDNYKSLQNDARYAIRFANRDVPWWTGPGGKYGINVVGDINIVNK
jgi:hypothetical protein